MDYEDFIKEQTRMSQLVERFSTESYDVVLTSEMLDSVELDTTEIEK